MPSAKTGDYPPPLPTSSTPVSERKKTELMETEQEVSSCAVWAVWSSLATMTLILGVVGDAQIQPFNEDVTGVQLMYNCAKDGALDALKSSLGLGIVALCIAWLGVVVGTGISCKGGCAVLGCGPCGETGPECCVANSHGWSWFLLCGASGLWIADFLILIVNLELCQLSDWVEQNRYAKWHYTLFGLGVAASVMASAALLAQIPGLLRADAAVAARRKRLSGESGEMDGLATLTNAPPGQLEMTMMASPQGPLMPPPTPWGSQPPPPYASYASPAPPPPQSYGRAPGPGAAQYSQPPPQSYGRPPPGTGGYGGAQGQYAQPPPQQAYNAYGNPIGRR